MNTALESSSVDTLITMIEESTRSTRDGVRYFIEPAVGTEARASSRRHHIIFGRRGSGKSSLLNKVLMESQSDRRPIVYIDMETFKAHSYPDVLISVLLSIFESFEEWSSTIAINPSTKTTFWNKIIGKKPSSPPIKHKDIDSVRKKVIKIVIDLRSVLYEEDSVNRTTIR
jgi:GTPase SAR1 family protein